MINVYIWRTGLALNRRAGSSSVRTPPAWGWGHVAIEIPDPTHGSDIPQHYMSYWPPEKKAAKCTIYYPDDVASCGGKADRCISISNLDETAMVRQWHEELGKDFHDVNHNCCTVAMRVLEVGVSPPTFGAGVKWLLRVSVRPVKNWIGIARFARGHVTTWTPGMIEALAEYLQGITK